MTAPALPITVMHSGFKADARVLERMPRRLRVGADLIELLYGGWLEDDLWDVYGDMSGYLIQYDDANTDRRVYVNVAERVRRAMSIVNAGGRAGTDYRVASAIIAELAGAGIRQCRCRGPQPKCRKCRGSGWLGPSMSFRADACGCRKPEFAERLHQAYLAVLSGLAWELRCAFQEYQRIERAYSPQRMNGDRRMSG